MKDNPCYTILPVMQLNANLVPASINKTKIKFLVPYDRLIVPVPSQVPCTQDFILKFQTITGEWIAYSNYGITRYTPPSINFSWLHQGYKTVLDVSQLKFDIDRRLYNFETIKGYHSALTFAGQISHLTENLRNTADDDLFKQHPKKFLKKRFSQKQIHFCGIYSKKKFLILWK